MKHLVLVVAFAAFSTSALAEGAYQNAAELRLVPAVSLIVEDDVEGGCLSNPNALKIEAELILRRSGISINVRALPGPEYWLEVSTVGREMGQTGTCAVSLRVELWRSAQAPEGHTALITAYVSGDLFAGYRKAEMQELLRTSVSEIVSDLANEILKARGN